MASDVALAAPKTQIERVAWVDGPGSGCVYVVEQQATWTRLGRRYRVSFLYGNICRSELGFLLSRTSDCTYDSQYCLSCLVPAPGFAHWELSGLYQLDYEAL